MRQILPGKVSDQDAATILGVLNTNSHELGEWGGSGLYMKALLMEHDCRPNCSFTTHGSLLTTLPRPFKPRFEISRISEQPTTCRLGHVCVFLNIRRFVSLGIISWLRVEG